MARPFRFGLQCFNLPPARWADELREIEALGYAGVYFPDHFGGAVDLLAGAMAAAVATQKLNVGTLVCDVDYRHPVVLAKSAATIQLASGGRLELGIGAGWMQSDYEQAGMAYDSHGVRIERLEEALHVLKGMWKDDETSFAGRHYRITKIAKAIDPLPPVPKYPDRRRSAEDPRRRGPARRHIGINPSLHEGTGHARHRARPHARVRAAQGRLGGRGGGSRRPEPGRQSS